MVAKGIARESNGAVCIFSDGTRKPEDDPFMVHKEDGWTDNPAIIRNRLKIRAAVKNARAFLRLQETHGSFDAFIWGFTGGRVIRNRWETMESVPAKTDLSDAVSKTLKQNGFTFVGSTICYSFLQAAGVVNDHLVGCFRHRELNA